MLSEAALASARQSWISDSASEVEDLMSEILVRSSSRSRISGVSLSLASAREFKFAIAASTSDSVRMDWEQ